MNENVHPAQDLAAANILLALAEGLSEVSADVRSPLWLLSFRRFSTLLEILILLQEADRRLRAAGAAPGAPIANRIGDLKAKTKRQVRNLLLAYGMIAATALVLGTIAFWRLFAMPAGDLPLITDPRDGDKVDMIIPVSGPSPRGSLPPGSELYVLVKPAGLNYWRQPLPEVNLTGWRTTARIGVDGDEGRRFLICAVVTSQELPQGWNDPNLPVGKSHCIDVIRK